jgi:pleiotropic regulator 1
MPYRTWGTNILGRRKNILMSQPVQKQIGKPAVGVGSSTAPSLFALRRAGAVVRSAGVVAPARVGVAPLQPAKPSHSMQVAVPQSNFPGATPVSELPLMSNSSVLMALQRKAEKTREAKWRPPWKLHRVISGHQGWVRTVDVDPSNEWCVTGSNDRMIKVWDLATGVLRVTLTGHTHNVRAVRIHPKLKYLFSAGEDNTVKCWDLESNKVIRHYHGHLSGVYCMDVHPTDNYLFTGSRDATVRMWDIRTKDCVHVLSGHGHTVQTVACQSSAPELVSGSSDATVRLWDIRDTGRSYKTLTHHKKGIRSVNFYQDEFVSAAPDNIKVWKSPEGEFERNMQTSSSTSILNCSAVRDFDGLFAVGSDSGKLHLYDWDAGVETQTVSSPPQPGSLECENGIFGLKFDYSGTRLISVECDKTIKIYKEDETAVEP